MTVLLSLEQQCRKIAAEKDLAIRKSGNNIEVHYRQNWLRKMKAFDTWEEVLNFINERE